MEELTAQLAFGTAILGLLAAVLRAIKKVHILVNSRMEEALSRIEQLEQVLDSRGIPSPESPKGKGV